MRHIKPILRCLRLSGVSIHEQLRIEEALFRVDKASNWFIYNINSHPTTIVMGISGKPDKLLHIDAIKRDKIPVLKRFSGGGTVIVDYNTIFATFICNKASLPSVSPFPREIMSWTETIYQPFFERLLDENSPIFQLREDDYVFGNKKIGGNAQSLAKDRWVHHTSFLYDFNAMNMEYLLNPSRQPKYREKRSHEDFLCTLYELGVRSKEIFGDKLVEELEKVFHIDEVDMLDVEEFLEVEHRKSTRFISLEDL